MNEYDILPDSFTYSIILNGLKINKCPKNVVLQILENLKIILK